MRFGNTLRIEEASRNSYFFAAMDLIIRQVPHIANYLIVGGGRFAHHLAYFFTLQNIPFTTWNRKTDSNETLALRLSQCDCALLAISDSALPTFYEEWKDQSTVFVHFSGAYSHPDLLGFHPLMTFSFEHLAPDTYSEIYFVGAEDEKVFRQIFPQLRNPYLQIPEERKAFYHCLCVLSGNGTILLWELMFKQFEKVGVPRQALLPYIHQISNNIVNKTEGRLTGPWYRGDTATIQQHQKVLQSTPLAHLYEEFYDLSSRV